MTIIKKSPPESNYYLFDAVKGKNYAICTCNQSSNMPFCDGTHKGSGKSPHIYTAPTDKEVFICACGRTDNFPHCDGTHKIPLT